MFARIKWPAVFLEGSRTNGTVWIVHPAAKQGYYETLRISLADPEAPPSIKMYREQAFVFRLPVLRKVRFSSFPELLSPRYAHIPLIKICKVNMEIKRLRDFQREFDTESSAALQARIIEHIASAIEAQGYAA